ncbi:F-box/LRR-repeat protein 16 [Homalodisca vitripennis]|nr:F-box/LRR-repeat protein 16 [Homalodisca vitripennis]
MSAQGVVERASAELSKRITGLGLRGKHHSRNGLQKTSVMERVTNVFCGGNVSSVPPDKPSRFRSKSATGVAQVHPVTPQTVRKIHLPEHPQSLQELLMDDRFLGKFFTYFSASERRTLAQVCVRWRDLLYRSPRYWSGLMPVVRCRELRQAHPQDRARLYASLLRRGFSSVCLLGAADEDALDLVHSFPLATKHVHSLSLRCSSVSDRGLEALLDHLQSKPTAHSGCHAGNVNSAFGVPRLTLTLTLFISAIDLVLYRILSLENLEQGNGSGGWQNKA